MIFRRLLNTLRSGLFDRLVYGQRRMPYRHRCRLSLDILEDRLPPAAGLASSNQQLLSAYGQLPLSFEANEGQTAAQVQYLTQGSGYSLFLTSAGAVLSLAKPASPDAAADAGTTGVALALNLVGANPQATVAGLDPLPGTSNYFIGNDPSQWHTGIANYSKVSYQNVYPGINLVYYGNQQQLEYDYQLAPGADPSDIRFAVQGADSVTIDGQGNLVLHTATGDVLEHAPVIYQQVASLQKDVSGQFVLLGGNEVGFQVGKYDATLPLVIDPVLSYSTYLGGSSGDVGSGIAVDGSGNAYVTGTTSSTNFPTATGAFQTSFTGTEDAFVTKLNATGSAVLYSTYLGGSYSAVGYGIAVDGSGNAYVAGTTDSSNFPTTTGAFQASTNANGNAFVTKLNTTGTALLYSSYLEDAGAFGIALDGSGHAYLTGYAFGNFPTTVGAFQPDYANGSADAFVAEMNSTGTGLVYSTYLGNNSSDTGQGIAVDGSGNAYVTGYTNSSGFPTTTGAFETTGGGAFVTKLNSAGSALVWSTYLGGGMGYGIALDSSGDAYVTGETNDTNFPTTTGAFQTSIGSPQQTFVTKLNANGTSLVYSTFLGGDSYGNSQSGFGIAVDSSGNAYVTGYTYSSNFPTTSDAFQTESGGYACAFLTKLNAGGSGLVYSTFLGGDNGNNGGNAIAVDGSGNAYVTGYTDSSTFPTTTGAFQTSSGGVSDAFVAKLDIATPTVASTTPTAGSPNGGTIVTITGTGFTNATAVMFGSTAATSFTIDSDTQITVTSPVSAPGQVDVTVVTPGGTSATSSADEFTYQATPTVSVSAANIAYGLPLIDAGISATATGLGGATAGSAFPGALVPAYFYPTPGGSPWDQLTAAAAAGTPIMAILNPDSGPGSAVDSNYVSAVDALRAAGGNVIGYVATGYASVPLATVESEIDDYRSWYNVNGIFVDEMTNDTSAADLQYYQAIDDYVHAEQPGWIVVGNPGTSTPEAYTQVADVLVEFENDTSAYGSSYTPPSWETNYPASRIANIVYNVASEATVESYVTQAESQHVGWLYVTDDTLPNPYSDLPSYWSDFLAAEAGSGDTAGPQGQTISGSFAFTYTDSQGNTSSTAPTAAGTYTVTATFTSTDPDYASGASGAATFSIVPASTTVALSYVDVNSDAANAAIYDGGTQRSMVNSVVYHFGTAVNLDASAITITLQSGVTVTLGNGTQTTGTVGTIPDASTWSTPDGGNTWVVAFGGAGVTAGGSIADGVYDITLNAAHITTESGGAVTLNDYNGGNGGTGNDTETFWCLFGDANETQKVTTQDFSEFAQSYLQLSTQPNYVAWFDLNANNKVTTQDYSVFAQNYLKRYSGFTATI